MRWTCKDLDLELGERPLVIGILNVTPDSFSDGGLHSGFADAVSHARRMLSDGADILDIGGESTRPGAEEVPESVELERVVPVIKALARETNAVISVDTRKAAVARAAIDAGARIVNDVTALTGDSGMVRVVRETGCGVILMHMLGTPKTMQADPSYDNVVAEVGEYLASRIASLAGAGIHRDCLAVDPGIGFGKLVEHNLELLAGIPRLESACGRPVVVGLSRKSFLGRITGREVRDRLAGSLAALTYSALRGARILRVHDVRESVDAVRVAMALRSVES
jgi:dihydropteroate synthase